jgi:hypothetical protein
VFKLPSAKDVTVDSEFLKVMCVGDPGCFAKNTMVLMANGGVNIVQNIKVGDKLMGDDNTPRTVLSLCRGYEQMYRVWYKDGTYYDVNESHILSMHYNQHKGDQVVNIPVKDYVKMSRAMRLRHKLYKAKIELPEYPVLIPPYILGLWLGDGTTGKPELTNIDITLIGYWKLYGETLGLSMYASESNPDTYRISNGYTGGVENPFTKLLRHYSLMEKKRIPKEYMFTSIKNRLQLIAGLLDTDGHLDQRTKRLFEISFKDEDMANDFQFICQSVGLHATLKPVIKAAVTEKGRIYGRYYLVLISRNVETIPTQVRRKIPIVTGNEQRAKLNFGFCVEKLKEDNYYGFEIDGNNLFLLADFSVVHNTGKSVFAGTFPTPGYLFDFSNGIVGYRGLDFDYDQFSMSPIGWVEFEKALMRVKADVKEGKYKTVIVDDLSAMTDLAMERSLQLDPKRNPAGGPLWQVHYGMVKNLMEGRLRQILDLNANIVFIAHLNVIKDEETGNIIGVEPLLTGQLSTKIPGYFDEVYYCSTIKKDGDVRWVVQTVPVGWNKARSRISGKQRLLPDIMNNDYNEVMAYIKGEKVKEVKSTIIKK